MISREEQLVAWQARQDEAAAMRSNCPICGGDSKVVASHMQATRREPCKFLGFEGVCVPCQMAWPVEVAQLKM